VPPQCVESVVADFIALDKKAHKALGSGQVNEQVFFEHTCIIQGKPFKVEFLKTRGVLRI
jgi:hypothetical protein